jgi:hypothetical protein
MLSLGAAAGVAVLSGGTMVGALTGGVATAFIANSVVSWLVDALGEKYVKFHCDQARTRHQAMMTQQLAKPLAEWLIVWPSTGGSSFERLQLALRRIPANVQQLEGVLAAKM